MIKEIRIKDFFSFRGENTITLNPGVNILLGINGSGKTSFLNAINLLYEGICGIGMADIVRQWGTYAAIVNASGPDRPDCISITYVFDAAKLKRNYPTSPFRNDVYYKITLFPVGDGSNFSLCESLYSKDSREKNKKFSFLEFRNGRGRISMRNYKGEITNEIYEPGMVSPQELALRQISDPQRFLPSFIIKEAISSICVYGKFNIDKVRQPGDSNNSKRLVRTGENLANILSYINNNHSFDYEKIITNLATVNPAFSGIAYNVFGSRLYISLRERNLSHAIDSVHISDGTMKYLLMMSIFMNPNRGYIVGVDEPESYLHPDMIYSIAKMLKEASKKTQLIIATHSPLLLNAFELDDLLVFEKNKENFTEIKYYTEADFPEYEAQLLSGQLWLNGEIGGKRW